MTKAKEGGSTFKEQELAGWEVKAPAYDDYAGKITTQIVEPLLDAAKLTKGSRVLDVACGPGYLAAGAARRGAQATGVDFASAMVVEAKKRFPDVAFQRGDAENLQFDNSTFDAVVCAFGIGHLAEPDKAISEAFRVLRNGGRYAFAWWCSAEKHEFFSLMFRAIKTHGSLEVSLPPAPPIFRFSDPEECRRSLLKAGFIDVHMAEVPLLHEPRSDQELFDLIHKSSVRLAMVLEAQAKDDQRAIHDAILSGARQYWHGNGYRIRWPALIVAATKT